MVSMARTPAEKEEIAEDSYWPSVDNIPDYPCGLSITLCQDELEKLGLEDECLEPGDILHIHAFALVTSVSKQASVDEEPTCRVELTLTHICGEDEDEENDDEEQSMTGKLYKK